MPVYISTKCHPNATGPYTHEDCVTGASVFNIGQKEWCQCSCHDAEAQRIAEALTAGKTRQDLIDEWYAANGGRSSEQRKPLRETLRTLYTPHESFPRTI